MDRAINFEFNGRPFEAYCPAAAVYDIYEHFGAVGSIPEIAGLAEPTRAGWDAVCWILAELCRWGELRRRQRGETPRDMLTLAELTLAPAAEAPRLRGVVIEALEAGFRRYVPDAEREEELRDLVLEELEGAQKKTPPPGSFGPDTSPLRGGPSDRTPRPR